MAWSAVWPLATGDDIQSTGVLDDLHEATLERRDLSDDPGEFAAAGTELHDLTARSMLRTAQDYLRDTAPGNWYDPTADYDGFAAGPLPFMGWSTMASLAGVHADGFAAHWPKEITDVADTTLVDGDAAANGDKALHTGDGAVYERIAGVWTRLGLCGTVRPDVKTARRRIEQGDYLTHSAGLLNDIRELFDVLTAKTFSVALLDTSDAFQGEANAATTWATATADADTDYAGQGTALTGPWCVARGVKYDAGSIGFNASTYGGRARYEVASAAVALACDIESLIEVLTPTNPESPEGYTTLTVTFDDNGLGAAENTWHRFSTVGPAVGNQITGWAGIDPDTQQPTWTAEPGPVPNFGDVDIRIRGVSFGFTTHICHFDVAGGFDKI